jgi:hypothetical protein
LKEYKLTGNGFVQKQSIDLPAEHFAAGMYLLQAPQKGEQHTFKIYKQ